MKIKHSRPERMGGSRHSAERPIYSERPHSGKGDPRAATETSTFGTWSRAHGTPSSGRKDMTGIGAEISCISKLASYSVNTGKPTG